MAGQYGFNATDIDETRIREFGSFDAKTELKAGNFELVGFPSQQALDEYISDINFGRNESHPAVCYGFQIHEDENQQKYELELFFNDLWIDELNSIPMQRKPAFDPSETLPQSGDHISYSFKGFAYMQNWVANTILKIKTGNPDAQITAFTVP